MDRLFSFGWYLDNVIVEGKGVWNECRVSFRIIALIRANKHKSGMILALLNCQCCGWIKVEISDI